MGMAAMEEKRTLKIEFEGTDGAGKTTGLKYFIEQAQKKGLSVIETREVGNPHIPACVKLRELVLNPENKLDGATMEFIFSAMRIENDLWLKSLVKSAEQPDVVVSDRGLLSHLAYTDHNVSEDFTSNLYMNLVMSMTENPNVVIYFKVNTDTALKRRVKRGTGMDAIEMKGIEYQEKVRESFLEYLDVARFEGIKVYEVDANQDIAGVQQQLDKILTAILQDVTVAP